MNPLLIAVPFFFGLMLFEYLLQKRRGNKVYSFKETISNLYCGIGQIFIEGIFKVPLLWLYYQFAKLAPAQLPTNIYTLIGLFILIDLMFYISHVLAHKIGWMWAIHGVHHQSEQYNFSVGLRMPWWHKLTAFWIHLPAAMLGFSLKDYVIVASIHASLQIWTHTQLFEKRIPVFEWIFVTPSHHRVHHGKNELYLDKNFGGILSIWDYLFKTYQPETEKVIYGINKIKTRVNPWSSNMIQFSPESWPKIRNLKKFNDQEKLMIWAFTTGFISLGCWYFAHEYYLNIYQKMIITFLAIISMISIGIWMDQKEKWSYALKYAYNSFKKLTPVMK